MDLQCSVGTGGRNRASDVKLVESKFSRMCFRSGRLENKIKLLQAIIHNYTDLTRVDKKKVDGRIDVGYSTHKWLASKNPPYWQEIKSNDYLKVIGSARIYTVSWYGNELKSIMRSFYHRYKQRTGLFTKQTSNKHTTDFGKIFIYAPKYGIYYKELVRTLESKFKVSIYKNIVVLNGIKQIPRIQENKTSKPREDVEDEGVYPRSAPAPEPSSKSTPNASDSSSNAPTVSTKKPKHLKIAEGELGVKEYSGSNHNPKIIEYHSTTGGFNTDEVPWCASFMVWVFKKAGYTLSGLNAGARSFARSSSLTKLDKPLYGSVIVFKYNDATNWSGHVGIVVDEVNGKYKVLGGNQSDSVKYSFFGKSKVHGFYWPNNVVKTHVLGSSSSSETQEVTKFSDTR